MNAGPAPAGAHTYRATDPRIEVMGRAVVDDSGAVSFGASGVTFYTKFRGTGMDADLRDEFRDSTGYNWFTVAVDGGEPTRFRTEPGKRWYSLADDLRPGVHTLALSKATEGQNGHNRLVALRTGELLQADPLPSRKIEFIGNSITAGYGDDARQVACGKGTWFDPSNAWLAYGPRLARRLHAQWMLSAVSGIGMVRNWNSLSPVMPDVYGGIYMEYADTLTSWDFGRYTPDLVLIALGTNDFSDGDGPTPRPALDGDAFVKEYTDFVAGVRGRYPDARILLVDSPMLDRARNDGLDAYLQEVVHNRRAAGDSAVTRFGYAGHYVSGCDGHPDLRQQSRMADELEPVVRATMGW